MFQVIFQNILPGMLSKVCLSGIFPGISLENSYFSLEFSPNFLDITLEIYVRTPLLHLFWIPSEIDPRTPLQNPTGVSIRMSSKNSF